MGWLLFGLTLLALAIHKKQNRAEIASLVERLADAEGAQGEVARLRRRIIELEGVQKLADAELSELHEHAANLARDNDSLQSYVGIRNAEAEAARMLKEAKLLLDHAKLSSSEIRAGAIAKARAAPEKNLAAVGSIPSAPATKKQRKQGISRAERLDRFETQAAMDRRHGMRTMYMHYSALSATTRVAHAARHGKLYTESDTRAWLQSDEHDDECRCSILGIAIGDDGRPLVPAIVNRAQEAFAKMKAKGKGEWTKVL